MLDIRLVREKPGLVRKNLKRRRDPEKEKWLEELIKTDQRWRSSLKNLEGLRKRRNIVTAEIAELKRQGKSARGKIKEMKGIPERIKELDEKTGKLREKTDWFLMRIPNMLHETVPYGKDEHDNVPVKHWGKLPKWSFPPKNHLEIAEGLEMIDSTRAAKIAGHGFHFLKGDLVRLDYAIMNFTMDFLVRRGFTPVGPPLMMSRKAYEGVVSLDDFEGVMYKVDDDDLYLIATSEHPMGAMFMDEVLERKQLPIRLCGVSPCFRKEVGSHGKYTKGLFRMHQFNKVEQFVFCHPDDSWKIHEELQKNCEDLYQALELPYRVVNVCTGDIGDLAAKKYDTEGLMADGEYREIGSNSNVTDYQARRLNIRFREGEGSPPSGFVHTLNNTALATSRTMVALLEINQQKDGSVSIPPALRPYMNKQHKLVPRK